MFVPVGVYLRLYSTLSWIVSGFIIWTARIVAFTTMPCSFSYFGFGTFPGQPPPAWYSYFGGGVYGGSTIIGCGSALYAFIL